MAQGHWELIRNRGAQLLNGHLHDPVPGDLVRLRFRRQRDSADGTYRIGHAAWLRIAHCVPGPSFVGLLEEASAPAVGMAVNSPILFEAEHIFEIASKTDEPVDAAAQLCVASRRLGQETAYATRALRVRPTHDQDSGWRFLDEDGEPEDLQRSNRVAVFRFSWLMHLDPSLKPLLGAPVGSQLERLHPGEPWAAVQAEVEAQPLAGC